MAASEGPGLRRTWARVVGGWAGRSTASRRSGDEPGCCRTARRMCAVRIICGTPDLATGPGSRSSCDVDRITRLGRPHRGPSMCTLYTWCGMGSRGGLVGVVGVLGGGADILRQTYEVLREVDEALDGVGGCGG